MKNIPDAAQFKNLLPRLTVAHVLGATDLGTNCRGPQGKFQRRVMHGLEKEIRIAW